MSVAVQEEETPGEIGQLDADLAVQDLDLAGGWRHANANARLDEVGRKLLCRTRSARQSQAGEETEQE